MVTKEKLDKLNPESREKAEKFFKLAAEIKKSGVTEKYFKN